MAIKPYYHGSPRPNIIILPKGSFVTPHLPTAYYMGMNWNGKKWSDADLKGSYKFGRREPKFLNSTPGSPVTIYRLLIDDKDLDKMENPYEHRTLIEIDIRDQS